MSGSKKGGHGYDSGRLNLPFVGLCSFGKYPYQPDWDAIDADFAVMGAPFDFGTQFRPGARFGPRSIREASTLFSFGHAGPMTMRMTFYLENDKVRIVDIGDADIIHTDTERITTSRLGCAPFWRLVRCRSCLAVTTR